ncbi:MAG: GTPase (G3E family), partial [Pseudobutyrivibrio sp.]|nr:GTPase (G3E family) [Pseudobutyrivibrio sp.]
MIKVDLITGFLGSGKTTFLKKYAKYFMDQGMRIGILENDYGAVNVDMLLLNELRGENCELEMVAGGCDADCHRRRFKTKLISMGMSGYDRVIIEPSGIFDVD